MLSASTIWIGLWRIYGLPPRGGRFVTQKEKARRWEAVC